MIRTTAEASSTSLAAPLAAISARTVLADQLLRAWIEGRGARRKGKCLKIGEGLPATLAAIAAADLLERLQIRQTASRAEAITSCTCGYHSALHGGSELARAWGPAAQGGGGVLQGCFWI